MKTMNCKNFKNCIPLVLSGEIDGIQRGAFERHLETCGACKREYEELKEVVEFLDVSECKSEKVVPIDYYRSHRRPEVRRYLTLAASFLVVALSVVAIYSQFFHKAPDESGGSKRAAPIVVSEKTKIAMKDDPYGGESNVMLGVCVTKRDEK